MHSLKTRIKRPENLIAKIVRKKLDDPDQKVTNDNYRNVITDLIGIRALHLFKNQWRSIHEFVKGTWDLEETPIAYVRDGDPENLQQSFLESSCKVEKHRFGYRSVHYLIKSQLAKQVQVAELQVRTLFEEGWSEIDHQVRYPRVTDNPHLAEFLTIFNRLAGSADEMGTFIQALSRYLIQQKEKLAEKDSEVKTKEKELKKAISELRITAKEKETLKAQVDQLRTFPDTTAAFTFQSSDNPYITLLEPSNLPLGDAPVWSSFLVQANSQEKTCQSVERYSMMIPCLDFTMSVLNAERHRSLEFDGHLDGFQQYHPTTLKLYQS